MDNNTYTTHNARIDFSPRWNRDGIIDKWTARPVGDGTLIDNTYGTAVQRGEFVCHITVWTQGEVLHFTLCTQGRERGGRRYREFVDFESAVTTAEKWAARRFKMVAEVTA